jgi:methylmalonyl-CoA mutase
MEAWRPLVDKALKGAPYDTLRTVTRDGLCLDPLHAAADPVYAGRSAHGDWNVVQRVDCDDGAAAQARADLENGANGLTVVFAGAPGAFGRGLTAATVDDLDAALDGVLLQHCCLHLEAGARGMEAFALALALCERRGTSPVALHAGIDPLGTFAADGSMPPFDAVAGRLAGMVRAARDLDCSGTILRADGRPLAEAGATPAQELAFALASTTAVVRALDEAGLRPDETLPLVQMALTATTDQFATIAKLRAARRLFRMVADSCGVPAPLTLHASTAHRMLAFSDPQTNLLRLTVAAFAAGAGGADSVTVLPFDAAASPFARRLARNIQTLLLEEAHLAELADPAAGSGTLETYTEELAQHAWEIFQAHEAGGLVARIADGTVAASVRLAAEREEAALAAGERAMIGVTHHPPQHPAAVPQFAPSPVPDARRIDVSGPAFTDLVAGAGAGATLADLSATWPAERMTAPRLAPSRAAAAFEG